MNKLTVNPNSVALTSNLAPPPIFDAMTTHPQQTRGSLLAYTAPVLESIS